MIKIRACLQRLILKNFCATLYLAYNRAIARLGRDIERQGGSLNHVRVRAKNQSTLHLRPKRPAGGVPRHNNRIESAWARPKRSMDIMSGYGEHSSDHVIAYNIINYNFIRPHSSPGEFGAVRHGKSGMINMTPAMAGGYPKWFASFYELLTESWGYDKSFVFKLGPRLPDRLRIGVRGGRKVAVTVKAGTPKSTARRIDRKLQTECGFAYVPARREWVRDTPSIMNMSGRREDLMGAPMPAQTFQVCNRCGRAALTTQAVDEILGYRRSGGRMIPQPNGHGCRARLSRRPRRPTGPNRSRMGKRSALLGIQKRLSDL